MILYLCFTFLRDINMRVVLAYYHLLYCRFFHLPKVLHFAYGRCCHRPFLFSPTIFILPILHLTIIVSKFKL